MISRTSNDTLIVLFTFHLALITYCFLMSDGIGSAVGQQIGEIGKQVAKDLVSIPRSMVGLKNDGGSINETASQGKNTANQQQTAKPNASRGEQIDEIANLKQQEDIDKQRKLSEIRRRLELLMNPQRQHEKSIHEIQQEEELEKKKLELRKMKEEAKQLKQIVSKRPRGDLYGVKAKRFGGEQGKNVVAQ